MSLRKRARAVLASAPAPPPHPMRAKVESTRLLAETLLSRQLGVGVQVTVRVMPPACMPGAANWPTRPFVYELGIPRLQEAMEQMSRQGLAIPLSICHVPILSVVEAKSPPPRPTETPDDKETRWRAVDAEWRKRRKRRCVFNSLRCSYDDSTTGLSCTGLVRTLGKDRRARPSCGGSNHVTEEMRLAKWRAMPVFM